MRSADSKIPKRQFNVQLPSELISQIKHAAVDERGTLSEFVEALLRLGLDARKDTPLNPIDKAPVYDSTFR